MAYTINRRPGPTPNSREISLPTNVVIDLTTWANAFPERSQLPPGVINPFTGYVDILLYPNGTVVPTTIYSTPSSFGMSGAVFSLLAGRAQRRGGTVKLGVSSTILASRARSSSSSPQPGSPYAGPVLKGEYCVVSLFARTGRITSSDDAQFDNPVSPANGSSYNPGYPFLAAEQGRP